MMTRFKSIRLLRWGVFTLAVGLLALAGYGCYPGDIESVTDLDIVLTQFDSTHVWAAPASFFLVDSVVHLQDTADAGNNVTLSTQFDSLIVAEVRKGLLAMGYTEQPTADSTDYYVIASALGVQNWTVNVWYPYYPCCYYGGGWGWYYPPVYDVDSYESGTLFIDMYDQHQVDSTRQMLGRPWTAILNGLLGTTAAVTQQRLLDGIHQAYEQSPYLKPQ
jgi:hypothetical protein